MDERGKDGFTTNGERDTHGFTTNGERGTHVIDGGVSVANCAGRASGAITNGGRRLQCRGRGGAPGLARGPAL